MPKKMAFERRAARQASKMNPPGQLGPGDYGSLPPESIPHEALTGPPGLETTADMAAGGQDLVRGNSNEMPLTHEGMADVAKTGHELARLGGVDQIIGSDAQRTRETAQALQATDPKQPPVSTDPGLESHALGQLEGEPKSPEVKKFLADMIRKNPDYRIPGQGAMSNRPGESFNEFRVRALSAVRGVMQKLAQNPHQSIALPKHSQVSKLVKAWIAKGAPDDLSVDPHEMIKDHSPKPGDVERFAPDHTGKWALDHFDPAKERNLPKGSIYFVEHGETPATAARSAQISTGQQHRAQIISHIRSGNWKGAQQAAKKASGHLSGQEISEAIDEALPSAQEVAQMPPHQLLPVASAASPAKRAEYLPAVHQAFGQMQGASPAAVAALKTHIGRLTSSAA